MVWPCSNAVIRSNLPEGSVPNDFWLVDIECCTRNQPSRALSLNNVTICYKDKQKPKPSRLFSLQMIDLAKAKAAKRQKAHRRRDTGQNVGSAPNPVRTFLERFTDAIDE